MIQDLQQEGKVVLPCLITKSDVGRTAKNAPYISLILEDCTGSLDAKYWNVSEEEAKLWKVGMIVEASGDLIRYRNAWQLRVRSLKQIEGNPIDYVRNAPIEHEKLKRDVYELIAHMTNPVIKDVVKELIAMNEEQYFTYPAAVRNHHNFPGGLAWHSFSMAQLALSVLKQYEWLDYDLLIGGILIHDIAKVAEYSDPILPEYTVQGNLLGHISMASNLIDRVAVALDVENSEEVMLLKHMVLSHHGKYDYGSPVLPMIAEAEVLTLLDNLDSRLFMIHETLNETTPGTMGPKQFALDGRMFYRKTWEDRENQPIKKNLETNQ